MNLIPVTYYPVATQRAFARNAERIAGKPYANYFDGELFLHDDVLPALQAPMDPADALDTSPASLDTLLDPGYHRVETGYCELADGTAYATSLTRFPGCTAEMFRWWFWWHSFEAERYSLWYPHNHVSVRRDDTATETAPGLTHEQRYIGSTHVITEYIGPNRTDIEITFVDPAEWGMATDRFTAAGIGAHACGVVHLQRPKLRVATMVHLFRETDDGFELRSRYWMADRPVLTVAGRDVDLSRPAVRLGLKRRMAGAALAYEQLLHDQIEFTHLASFLPAIHAEFGSA